MHEQHVHFIGIGGIGMSALAHVLADKGVCVSGSDLVDSAVLHRLQEKGVHIFIGHKKENIKDATTVVRSTDVDMENPECKEAVTRGVRLIHRSQLLAELLKNNTSLLVAGTHGKTTTSSLLVHVFVKAHFDPSYAIGGFVHSLGSNGGGGQGSFFIAEADESDGSFLNYLPSGAIITNIDNDHLEYWKSEEALMEGFKQFAAQVSHKEALFWCKDDDRLDALDLDGYSYGFSEDADLYIENYRQEGWQNVFDFRFKKESYQEVVIPLVGAHNVLNASAVFGIALEFGIPADKIREALKSFSGVGRRVEKKGEAREIVVYDDYAHHPSEIMTTLRAMVAAVQPHRYTRLRDCMHQFPQVFDHADVLILTDIYSAREEPIAGITSKTLLEKIQAHSSAEVHYVPREELVNFFIKILKPGDVLVTMGAGDITKTGPELLKRYES